MTAMPTDAIWHPRARVVASPNCDARPLNTPISLIVIHNISLPPNRFGSDDVERLFTNRLIVERDPFFAEIAQLRVSSHFFIRREGELMQFVDCAKRAWHAGASVHRGRERCNDFSLGIELEGTDTQAFTAKQYARCSRLVTWLAARFPIDAIAGHSEIAPGRKTDPGPTFDWARLQRDANVPAAWRR